jgi:hypothetical protein
VAILRFAVLRLSPVAPVGPLVYFSFYSTLSAAMKRRLLGAPGISRAPGREHRRKSRDPRIFGIRSSALVLCSLQRSVEPEGKSKIKVAPIGSF